MIIMRFMSSSLFMNQYWQLGDTTPRTLTKWIPMAYGSGSWNDGTPVAKAAA